MICRPVHTGRLRILRYRCHQFPGIESAGRNSMELLPSLLENVVCLAVAVELILVGLLIFRMLP